MRTVTHVATGGGGLAKVLIGSALTEDDGETPVGNFGVLEAPTREAAQAFAESDPYARAGLVESHRDHRPWPRASRPTGSIPMTRRLDEPRRRPRSLNRSSGA